jgi:hypothetical protein
MPRKTRFFAVLLLFATFSLLAQTKPASNAAPGMLKAEELKALLPDNVFFHGQRAPVNLRNAGGVRYAGGKLMLVALVDTSGYSTDIAEKYHATLITEGKLKIGDATLAPGEYGCGFAGDKFVVMDVGGNDLVSAPAQTDEKLKRPRPLMIVSDGGGYRVYFGKRYFSVKAAQ